MFPKYELLTDISIHSTRSLTTSSYFQLISKKLYGEEKRKSYNPPKTGFLFSIYADHSAISDKD